MTTTPPEPNTTPQRRQTAEERAQRNPLVRMVTAVTQGAKQWADDRRTNRMLRQSSKIARRDAFANDPTARDSNRRLYYSGVSPESIAAQTRESQQQLVEALERQQGVAPAGQQPAATGPEAMRSDTQSALEAAMPPPVESGQQHAPGSTDQQSGATPIERGKGSQGIGK